MDSKIIDPAIFGRALANFRDAEASPDARDWLVETYERRRSVVSKLIDSTSGTVLYYKQHRPTSQDLPNSSASLKAWLENSAALTREVSRRFEGTRISVPEILTVDPERLIVVTRAVDGTPMKRGPFTSALRRSGIDYASLLGWATNVIEQVGRHPNVTNEPERIRGMVDRRLDTAGIGGAHAAAIRMAVNAAAERSVFVWCHGDLSHSNILLSPEGAAIIDFGWIARPIGYDLGLFSYRITGPTKLSPRVGLSFVRRMTNAYRDAAGDSYHAASLAFVDLLLMLRGLTSQSYLVRARSRRTLRRRLRDGSLGEVTSDRLDRPFAWLEG